MHVMYVLQYSDGALAGIDWQSGGYPYPAWNVNEPNSLTGVKFYTNKEEALEFVKSFKELRVAEFQFSTITISSSRQEDMDFLSVIKEGYEAGYFTEEDICHKAIMSRSGFKRWLNGRNLPHPAMRTGIVSWINKLKEDKNK